jgi:two-component system response regulator PilR (NtrC family)
MNAPVTQPKPAAPETPTASVAPGKVRILVVDDEPSMREMLRIVLRRDGYEVIIAENGRDAIEQLRKSHVDLLLSDIKMPDVTGVEVLRAAKDINRDIVAFMMTAYASASTAVEAMRLGAVDYFTKPFSMDELRLKIRQHVETHRLKQENVLLKKELNTRYEFSNIIGRSEPAPARTWSPAPSTTTRSGASVLSWRSTAAASRRRCSSPSSSATCAARSRAPTPTRRG